MFDIVAILGTLLGLIVGLGIMLSPLFIIMRYMKKHNKGWNDPLFEKGECKPQTQSEQYNIEKKIAKQSNITAFLTRLMIICGIQSIVSMILMFVYMFLFHDFDTYFLILMIFMVLMLVTGISGAIMFKIMEVTAYRADVSIFGADIVTATAQRDQTRRFVAKTVGTDYVNPGLIGMIIRVSEHYAEKSGFKTIPKWIYIVINICCYGVHAAIAIVTII